MVENLVTEPANLEDFEQKCLARGLVFLPSESTAVHRAYVGLVRSLATIDRLAELEP